MPRGYGTKRRKQSAERENGSRGKRRPLRRESLVRAAHEVLARWASLSPDTYPINISRLAKELGVTRQAIYDNNLGKDVSEHKALQQRNFSVNRKAVAIRKPLEQRISLLEQEIDSLRGKLDGWIERWAAVEYNARMLGIDADKIFAAMPPTQR
jgi:hypothetical protein